MLESFKDMLPAPLHMVRFIFITLCAASVIVIEYIIVRHMIEAYIV